MRILPRLLALFAVLATLTLAATGQASAATTWKQTDKVCKTVGAGTACVATFTNAKGGFRYVASLRPASGKWMQAVQAVGYTAGSGGVDPVCSGSCPKVTKAWSHTVTYCAANCVQDTVDLTFTGTSGKAHVVAGVSSWGTWKKGCTNVAAGTVCVSLAGRSNRTVTNIRASATFTPKSGAWIKPIRVTITEVRSTKTFTATRALCGCKKTARSTGSAVVTVPDTGTFKSMKGTAHFATSAGTRVFNVAFS